MTHGTTPTRQPLSPVVPDLAAAARRVLAEHFPDVIRDGRLDLDRLRELLGEVVDEGPERYGLSWAGRRAAVRLLQTPSSGTLIPEREQSVRFDASDHVFVAGENLEVLKLLQRSYHDRVKAIYIDPPYNTGKGCERRGCVHR